MSQPPPSGGRALAEIVAERRRKADLLQRSGRPPWGADFKPTMSCAEAARLAPPVGEVGEEALVAGRILGLRTSGGIAFADCNDASGSLQLLAQRDNPGGDLVEQLEGLDLGDIVGAEGRLTRTKRGEPSLKLGRLTMLAKSLRPPAAKSRVRVEQRYRRRYLDLLSEPSQREIFRHRSQIVVALRRLLDERGFLEVETPILQAIPGGGAARPFRTHHHSLDTDLYLRVAIELYLKRLLVAGFERVYELGRTFRNEGLSPRHNPEFTLLEAYQAYADLEAMKELCQELVTAAAKAAPRTAGGALEDGAISLEPPFPSQTMSELVHQLTGLDLDRIWAEPARMVEEAARLNVEVAPDSPSGRVLYAIYEQLVEPNLTGPVFVTQYPIEVSPLARRSPDPRFVERFELVISGREVANAFAELNDPVDQRQRLEDQARQRAAGDLDAQPFDEDFVEALEHGMPPAGGIGIGVDRLVMLVTGTDNIRDVVLFPTLRPQSGNEAVDPNRGPAPASP
ncbi:MAG TPA: lysine--tRNA ligase [Candidatus Dormibacteraeota bacterium]